MSSAKDSAFFPAAVTKRVFACLYVVCMSGGVTLFVQQHAVFAIDPA